MSPASPSETGRSTGSGTEKTRISDLWRDFRNRLLTDPKFQRFAISFPLTRPIARARTRALFDVVAGFVYSQVLYACVELDLFERLKDGPQSIADLAAATDMPLGGFERLARAAVALELFEERRAERLALGNLGAALIGNPSVFAMISHHAALYSDLSDPVLLLRQRSMKTRLAKFWSYDAAGLSADETKASAARYSDLMSQTQDLISAEVIEACGFASHRRLLDVGGGTGTFLMAAGKAAPEIKLALCDLPEVTRLAGERFRACEMNVDLFPCDFHRDALPTGADIITLVRVLHDHDDAEARALLKKIHAALPKGGKIVIAEPMSDTPGAKPIGDAYFGFYLWAMGRGRPRAIKEIRAFLIEAGFADLYEARSANPLLVRIVSARAA